MNTKLTESTLASANTAVIAKTEGTANNRKYPMKATQEDYLKLPENVRLTIRQIMSYLMACTNPARMFFHRSEICTAVFPCQLAGRFLIFTVMFLRRGLKAFQIP